MAQAPPYGTGYDYGKGQTNYGYDQNPPPSYASTNPEAYTHYPQSQPMQTLPVSNHTYPDNDGTHTAVDGFNSASFSDKGIRRAFVKKVYLILTAQLLVTFAFICLFIFVQPIKNWVQTYGLWFYILAYITFLITYISLVCCPSVRKNSPGNFICLAVFTLAFSYMTATISSYHSTTIVLLAIGITLAVCLAVSLFAIQTKIDFTMCNGLLFGLLMVLFFFGWACLISYYVWGYNSILNAVYAGLGALVFTLFLIYDTQQIMGDKRYALSPEEYISGALQLYLDVVYIFLFLLSLFGNK